MELVLKVIITLIFLFVAGKGIHWTWTTQIDVGATASKFINSKPKIADAVVTRDVNKIYQSNKIVAEVSGKVKLEGDICYFEQLINVSNLNIRQPLEYQRTRFQIISYASSTAMKFTGVGVLHNVLEGVECVEIVE